MPTSCPRPAVIGAALLLGAGLLGPPPAHAGPLLSSFRQARAAHHTLRALERSAAAQPGSPEKAALVQRARQNYEARRAIFWKRLKQTPALQVMAGIFVDGPRQTFAHIKAHPLKTGAIVVGAAVITTGAGALGVPVDLIALAASGALALKAAAGKIGVVRAAFHNKRANRWRLLGEEILFPEVAFGAGLAASLAAEAGVAALEEAVPPLRAPAAALGAKSTAQVLDDLVPVASTLDDRPPAERRSPWRRLLGLRAPPRRAGHRR